MQHRCTRHVYAMPPVRVAVVDPPHVALRAEQYPKALGNTVKELQEVLPEGTVVADKTRFSMCGAFIGTARCDIPDLWTLCAVAHKAEPLLQYLCDMGTSCTAVEGIEKRLKELSDVNQVMLAGLEVCCTSLCAVWSSSKQLWRMQCCLVHWQIAMSAGRKCSS